VRTWWHPLLAGLLRWQLGDRYELEEEVNVGQKPLQIDILLLLRKGRGGLPEAARRVLAGLAEYLGERTLIEFKSPSDTLRQGDFQTFLAYAFLYRAQRCRRLAPGRLHLVVLAPRLTRPYRREFEALGVTAEAGGPGVWRLRGGPAVFPTWVVETAVLTGLGRPLLTLVSPQFLRDCVATYDALSQGGYTKLVVYLAQQIHQFRLKGKEFEMQHLGAKDEMERTWRALLAVLPPEERLEDLSPEGRQRLLAALPPEERQRLLAALPPEERLRGLPPEERLRGLPPEERLEGLSPEELERLRQLLQAQAKADDPPRPG
jgi:hypothetical protein